MTQENSQRVNFLKFVCAVLIVCIHCGWAAKPWFGWSVGDPWSLSWIANQSLFCRGLARMAVPFFFLCSGYFLAKHLGTKEEWGAAVLKRVRTLGAPFIIWVVLSAILIPLGVRFVQDVCAGNLACPASAAFLRKFNWLNFVYGFWHLNPVAPFWYLKSLFFFVLIAPLIAFCVKKLGWVWLLFCFVLSILYYLTTSSVMMRRLFYWICSLRGLFYISVGIYIYNKKSITIPFRWGRVVCALIALALIVIKLVLKAQNYGTYSKMVEEAAVPFIIYVVWSLVPARNLPRWMANMSFPIYLMHMSLFVCIDPLCNLLHIAKGTSFTLSFVRLFIGVFGSILVAHALRRYFPRFARVAFCER